VGQTCTTRAFAPGPIRKASSRHEGEPGSDALKCVPPLREKKVCSLIAEKRESESTRCTDLPPPPPSPSHASDPVTRIYESSYRRVRGAPVDPLGCVRVLSV
jgi:hypothetical protein